jgi:hypothetical protein
MYFKELTCTIFEEEMCICVEELEDMVVVVEVVAVAVVIILLFGVVDGSRVIRIDQNDLLDNLIKFQLLTLSPAKSRRLFLT